MTAILDRDHALNGNVPIINYKKALSSIFDKKKAWNYFNERRVAVAKRKQEVKKHFLLDAEVLYN